MKTHLLCNFHEFLNLGMPSRVVYYEAAQTYCILQGVHFLMPKLKCAVFPDYIKHIFFFKYERNHKTHVPHGPTTCSK